MGLLCLAPTALFRFEEADGFRHWLGFQNFYAITRYNHSRLYAMAVHTLAAATDAAAAGGAAAAR